MTVKGIKPTKEQRRWIDIIENPNIKYVSLVVSRQSGKTMICSNLLVKYALQEPNQILLWISPSYQQSRKVGDDIYKAIKHTNLVTSYNRSNYELELTNGSKILFRSGERADNIRGYSATVIIIDEAAFLDESVYDEVIRPMILVKGKKLIAASTPKGKNWFYDLHLKGLSPEFPEYTTIQADSYQNPLIPQNEVEEAKKTLPDHIFKQEYMAQFLDNNGTIFTNLDSYCVLDQYPKPMGKTYAGLDLGRAEDYTVLTIVDQEGNIIDIYRDRQKTWEVLVSNIITYLNKYKPTLQVEVNSMGDVIYEMIKKRYYDTHPFQTNTQSKQNIIEDLIIGLNEQKLKLPSKTLNVDLYNELQTFTYTYNPKSRNVKYESKKGFHDDMIMSLAITYNTLKTKHKKGTYAFR